MSDEILAKCQSLEMQISSLGAKLVSIGDMQLAEQKSKSMIYHRLDTLLNMLPGGVIVLDAHGVIVQRNPSAIKILGVDPISRQWSEVMKSLYTPCADDGLEISLANGKKISVATSDLGTEPGQIILLSDLTETRGLQKNINQQQRLVELGSVIGSLAHQIKTPLATALIYISHIHKKTLSTEQAEQYTSLVYERLKFLSNLIECMLIYIKGSAPVTGEFNIKQLLNTFIEENRQIIQDHNVKLKLCNSATGVTIRAGLVPLTSALSNLLINSIDASGDKPDICIIAKVLDNNHVGITVSDRGVGVDAKDLANIIKPFFTTKATGTGLGLSVVKLIVQSYGGKLEINSSRKYGTKVTIQLPFTVTRR